MTGEEGGTIGIAAFPGASSSKLALENVPEKTSVETPVRPVVVVATPEPVLFIALSLQ